MLVLLGALGGCARAVRGQPPAPVAATLSATAGSAAEQSPTVDRMIESARSMLGRPYRWGGAAPGGFDCSGLVVYAAANAGLRLPHTAHELQKIGVPIARGGLRRGDLLFMNIAGKGLHVAIALDAERFIHAPSSGGQVRIDSLTGLYERSFLGARRIIAR